MDLQQSNKYKWKPKVLFRRFVQSLPKSWRFPILRKLIRLPFKGTDGLEFRVAKTKEELEQAFRILHDEYVRLGFMDPDPSGLRVTPYHALPSTSTLIGVQNGEVIATVSIIRDSAFGLPMQHIFSIQHLGKRGARVAEISSLAIKKGYRENHGKILFLLIKFMIRYCKEFFGVEVIVFAVWPRSFDFYESIFLCQPLPAEVKTYDFVKGKPAKGGFLNLRQAHNSWAFQYGMKSPEKNLYQFMVEYQPAFLKYPNREYFKTSDPFLTPGIFRYFFTEKTNVLSRFSQFQLAILRSLYNSKAFLDLIPEVDPSTIISRENVRYDVACDGRIIISSEFLIKLNILNVSEKGLMAHSARALRFGEESKIQVLISSFEVANLKGWPVWQREGVYGFHIAESCEKWRRFVQKLEKEHELLQNYKTAS